MIGSSKFLMVFSKTFGASRNFEREKVVAENVLIRNEQQDPRKLVLNVEDFEKPSIYFYVAAGTISNYLRQWWR
jgi:hypothetical protein